MSKSREQHLRELLSKLGQEFSGFTYRGCEFIAKPVSDILTGFYFEPYSQDSLRKWITYYAIPLYVPTEFAHFVFGCRLARAMNGAVDAEPLSIAGAPDYVQETMDVLKNVGLPRVSEMRSLEGFLLRSEDDCIRVKSWRAHRREAQAYTSIKLLDYATAANSLEDGLASIEEARSASTSGRGAAFSSDAESMKVRLSLMLKLLNEGRREEASSLLDTYKEGSIRSLKLERYL